MSITVSVVIPVYNVAPFLERCLQSVWCQSYPEIETILVDDGSTDGSGALCDKLVATHPGVRVIHQANQGLSGARNTGIHEAQGEYLLFLDADDEWLIDDGIAQLVALCNPQTDLLLFEHVDLYDADPTTAQRVQTHHYHPSLIGKSHTSQALFRELVLTQQFSMSACFLMVRRDLLVRDSIYFPMRLISEDVFWSMQLWQHVKQVQIASLPLYGYHHRTGSLTTTPTLRVDESYDKIFSYWKQQCYNGCINGPTILVYLANLWVSRGYHYHKHSPEEKPAVRQILQRHTDLLRFAATPKAKRTALLANCFGLRATLALLGLYWNLRSYIKRC